MPWMQLEQTLILYLPWAAKKKKTNKMKNSEVISFLRSLKVLKECTRISWRVRWGGQQNGNRADYYCLLSPNLECDLIDKITLFCML